MLLTITTTHRPATDIGYLLGKNPNRSQSFSLAFGQGHVFYPVATEERCTVSLLLDIDPVALVRGRRGSSADSGLLGQYVNDRPYVASSFLSVAIASVYGSAMKGYTKERQELANTKIPLTAEIPAVQCRGGGSFLRRLFEPLGYTVQCKQLPLDIRFPEWGESSYFGVLLSAECRLQDLLTIRRRSQEGTFVLGYPRTTFASHGPPRAFRNHRTAVLRPTGSAEKFWKFAAYLCGLSSALG